jgi:hypothetical protein
MATVFAWAADDPTTTARVDITRAASYFYHKFSDSIRAQIGRVSRRCRSTADKNLATAADSDKAVADLNLNINETENQYG